MQNFLFLEPSANCSKAANLIFIVAADLKLRFRLDIDSLGQFL